MSAVVFHYKVLNQLTGEWVVQPDKMTSEGIASIGGQIIEQTAQTVADVSLDRHGHYLPDRP